MLLCNVLRIKSKESDMPESLMTDKDVAELLRLKPATIRMWVHLQKIPCVKIGEKCVRFEREKIENWLRAKSRPARKDGKDGLMG